jgi:integrase
MREAATPPSLEARHPNAFAERDADSRRAIVQLTPTCSTPPLHSLRHSYVTHLLEFGYPELFVQQQVGHSHASTTGLYTSVSNEFRNRLVERSLERFGDLWEVK